MSEHNGTWYELQIMIVDNTPENRVERLAQVAHKALETLKPLTDALGSDAESAYAIITRHVIADDDTVTVYHERIIETGD